MRRPRRTRAVSVQAMPASAGSVRPVAWIQRLMAAMATLAARCTDRASL